MAVQDPASEAAIRQGQEAAALLDHPMIQGALTAMETLSVREFTRSKFDEKEVRERAYRRLQAAQEFRLLLTTFVTTGRLEEEAASRADAEAKAAELPKTDFDTPNERRIAL